MYSLRGLRELAIRNLAVLFSNKDKAKARLLHGDIHDKRYFYEKVYQFQSNVGYLRENYRDYYEYESIESFKYEIPVIAFSDLHFRYKTHETEFCPEDFLLIHNMTVAEISFSPDNIPLKKAYELFNENLNDLAHSVVDNGKLLYEDNLISIYIGKYLLIDRLVIGVHKGSIEFAFLVNYGIDEEFDSMYDIKVESTSDDLLFEFRVSDVDYIAVPMSRNRYKFERDGYIVSSV